MPTDKELQNATDGLMATLDALLVQPGLGEVTAVEPLTVLRYYSRLRRESEKETPIKRWATHGGKRTPGS